jgi:hypothetical protein
MASALEGLLSDRALTVRVQAIKGLWQFWFWSADDKIKSNIEDAILRATAKPHEPWVASNLREAIYNLADENIRYLYNNWLPSLPRQEDREQAIRGRLASESRLADKFASVLQSGSDAQKKLLLAGLVNLPLRRGDIYDLEADLAKDSAPVYNRIGNDIEQIAFFGPSAERMAAAISPLLDSSDRDLRRLAAKAVLLVREARFPDVNRLAGPSGTAAAALLSSVKKIPEAADVAQVLSPRPAPAQVAGTARRSTPNVKLDEAFFRGYVQPILERRGRDGYACVHCHASHTLFNGTLSTVMNVVDTSKPEASLLLQKPTSTAESEGVAGASTLAHGGGVRFTQDSAEYTTILQWIKGAKE